MRQLTTTRQTTQETSKRLKESHERRSDFISKYAEPDTPKRVIVSGTSTSIMLKDSDEVDSEFGSAEDSDIEGEESEKEEAPKMFFCLKHDREREATSTTRGTCSKTKFRKPHDIDVMIRSYLRRIDRFKKQLDQQRASVNQLRSAELELNGKITTLQNKLKQQKAKRKELKRTNQTLTDKVASLQKELKQKEKANIELKSANKTLRNNLTTLREDFKKQKNEIFELKTAAKKKKHSATIDTLIAASMHTQTSHPAIKSNVSPIRYVQKHSIPSNTNSQMHIYRPVFFNGKVRPVFFNDKIITMEL